MKKEQNNNFIESNMKKSWMNVKKRKIWLGEKAKNLSDKIYKKNTTLSHMITYSI